MCAASLRFLRLHTCDQTLLLLERTDVSMAIAIVETVSNIALCAIALKLGGLIAAAIGMLVGTGVTCVGAFAVCFARFELPIPAASVVLRIIAAAVVMGLAVRALAPTPNALSLALAIGCGALIYSGVIAALFPESRQRLARQFRWLAGVAV